MDNFAGILTQAGTDIIADSIATGTAANIGTFVIGDGNGEVPVVSATQTTLVNEVYRGALNAFERDSKNPGVITASAVVPAAAGPFWMREFGIETTDGTLFAVTALPPQYKISGNENSTAEMLITMKIVVSEQANVSLLVDGAIVMATRDYVDSKMEEHLADPNPHPQYLSQFDTLTGVSQMPFSVDGNLSQRMTQRGVVANSDGGSVSVIFPEKFPNECDFIEATFIPDDPYIDGATGLTTGIFTATVIENTQTGCTVCILDFCADNYPQLVNGGKFQWKAEGY